jgi:hypothetical protein
MLSIISACFFFTISFIIHVLLSRILLLLGKKSIKLLFVFGLGFIFHLVALSSLIQPSSSKYAGLISPPLPFTSALLYLLLFILFLIYYLSTYGGETGPSIKLYYILKKYKKRTLDQLLSGFSEADLIHKRLLSLKEGKFIAENKKAYIILPKGKRLAYIIKKYRSFVRWESSG